MKFEEIDWHDQIILNINIDRTNAGKVDTIELFVLLDENQAVIRFNDVYQAELRLNFGVIAEESIKYAINNTEDSELLDIKNRWSKLGAVLDGLNCFEFNTNSTNSFIKIYALSCEIVLQESI
jgi:hypothetical protein